MSLDRTIRRIAHQRDIYKIRAHRSPVARTRAWRLNAVLWGLTSGRLRPEAEHLLADLDDAGLRRLAATLGTVAATDQEAVDFLNGKPIAA